MDISSFNSIEWILLGERDGLGKTPVRTFNSIEWIPRRSPNVSYYCCPSRFQFHWMDSLTYVQEKRAREELAFNSIEWILVCVFSPYSPPLWGTFNSIEWILCLGITNSLDFITFQFHWMDSSPASQRLHHTGGAHPFNSIEWIPKIFASIDDLRHNIAFNSIEWIRVKVCEKSSRGR